MPAFDIDADSVETPTILGNQRTNPCTISNMRQAYNNLGLISVAVNVTDLYVRFLPNSAAQLSTLDSILDTQGLELFDTPMDYDVLQEGDYYQDPSIPDSMVTWQYAVVPPSFQFPSGITYQVLSQLHLPGDDSTAIETEAERLASIQDSINCSNGGGLSRKVTPYVYDCGPGYYWDFNLHKCVCTCCPDGYYWDGTQCAPIPPPPPQMSAPDAQVPAGMITVSDVNLNTTPGVRNVRIVAKRWFKIERTYTDNNGNFHFTKHFKHKVKINVKFKNSYANIRGVRGIRLWQMMFPVKKTIGVYKSNKNNIQYNFARYTSGNNISNLKGNRYWVAATLHNAVLEQRDYSAQFGFSAPPMGLNIYITNWGIFSGLSSTPLFGKRFVNNIPSSFINTFLTGYLAFSMSAYNVLLLSMAEVTRARLDMVIDYHVPDVSYFTSDFIKETAYHELSHASQYSYAGNSWYNNFVSAELAEVAAHPNPNDSYNPYGSSTSSDAPIIGLGEAWGYHMGHFLADQRYGVTGSCQAEQAGGFSYCNNNFTTHPHIDVLEYFNPNLSTDPFKWIPKGLMWDLMDNTPNEILVNDQVYGFTIQQIFAALQSDVTSPQEYRARFIQLNPGNQTNQITNLFASYHY